MSQDFITDEPSLADLVVDSTYIYWANYGWPVPTLKGTTIGRARLDGTEVNQQFITGAAAPAGLAIQP